MSLVSEINDSIKASLRVCLPCKVDRFYPADQTVDLIPLVKDLKPDGDFVDIPVLSCVPVQFPPGLTFPVATGDEGIVVFADKSTEEWFQNGSAGEPVDPRRHHLSDGFFIPGFRSSPNKLNNFDTNAVVLGVGDATTEPAVLGTTQKNAFDSFVTSLSNALMTVLSTGVSPTGPVQFAGLAALSTAIDAAKASYDSAQFLSTHVKVK